MPRALAWGIDCLIKYTGLFIGLWLLAELGDTGLGLWLMLLFAVEWFYPVLFERFWNGSTPGKRLLGLQVIGANGTPVSVAASLIRNLLRAADFLPLFYGCGLVSMLVDRDSRRLGDLAAGTVVVYRDLPPVPGDLPAVPPQRPRFPLLPDEQRLLIHFAERSRLLTPERQAELARLLQRLNDSSPDSAVRDLHGNARWLAGDSA